MSKGVISLRRFAKITGSLAWGRAYCAYIETHILYRKPEIKDLAMMVPTEAEYDRLQNGDDEHEYKASKTRWRRLLRGEILAVNDSFINRINETYPEIAHLKNHPLWYILGSPQATKAELKQLIKELDPKLKGKLYCSLDDEGNIQHRRFFSGPERYAIAESIDAFTLKLILLRMNELTLIEHKWRLDLDALTRHLLRLLTHSHLCHAADRLLHLYLVFINTYQGNNEPQLMFETSQKFDEDLMFGLATSFRYERRSELNTLNTYLQTNDDLIEAYWLQCHPGQSDQPSLQFKLETLYLADLYSEQWANGDILKSEIFKHWAPDIHDRKIRIW